MPYKLILLGALSVLVKREDLAGYVCLASFVIYETEKSERVDYVAFVLGSDTEFLQSARIYGRGERVPEMPYYLREMPWTLYVWVFVSHDRISFGSLTKLL